MKVLKHRLAVLLGILLMPITSCVGTVLASGDPPVIDAGPPKAIAFPAKDLTLFGHATDPENDPLTVRWTQTGGPASVAFSAPQALATTVKFTATGTYTFRLTVSDGTSTVTADTTVTVNSASSQTALYVDPTYTGGSNDGSAAHPWTTLAVGATSAQWNAINKALATAPVIVYFSARQASSDTPEVERNEVNLWRTDTSTNRLTLDGMSKYNTNDATPSWADYGGTSRFQINIARGSISIGVQSSSPQYPTHYTTVRGFDVTGASGRVILGGNYSVLEYMHVHDITAIGATVMFQGAVNPDCTELFGRLRDITYRNNVIERGIGEGIYIAANYQDASAGGCPSYGNSHQDILIEGNTITDPGTNGGESDGIDLKAGLLNVTVRNNVISGGASVGVGHGITSDGIFGTQNIGQKLIERNRIHNAAARGMSLGLEQGLVIRQNLVYNNTHGAGISISGAVGLTSHYVQIYNNTIYGNFGLGLAVGYSNGSIVMNNLVINNDTSGLEGRETSGSTSTNLVSDYNMYGPKAYNFGMKEGSHSIVLPSTTGVLVDPTTGDLHLTSTSPAIDTGVDLSATGFATDFNSIARPQGMAWDIGAYEFRGGVSLIPNQPGNLVVK